MRTFEEWAVEEHGEQLDEFFGRFARKPDASGNHGQAASLLYRRLRGDALNPKEQRFLDQFLAANRDDPAWNDTYKKVEFKAKQNGMQWGADSQSARNDSVRRQHDPTRAHRRAAYAA